MRLSWLYDPMVQLPTRWLIFGAGQQGILVHQYLSARGCEVIAFVDNSPLKQGSRHNNVPVIPPGDIELFGADVSLVIATGNYSEIVSQLREMKCPRAWLGLEDHALDLAEKLVRDPTSIEASNTVLVLPEEAIPEYHLECYLKWFRYRFAHAKTAAVAAPPQTLETYRKLCPDIRIEAFDTDIFLECFDTIVFTQPWERNNHWTWMPLGYSALNSRIYVLQATGRFRCTNRRTVSALDFPAIDTHAFFQAGVEDTQSVMFLFPTGMLYRDASLAPVNAFGYRVPEQYRNLVKRDARHLVICLFGGSAAWGQGNLPEETLSYLLERRLSELADTHTSIRFTVLNFAQPGATVTNEIQSFFAFAEQIRPDVVISHSGFNDLYYGQLCDPYLVEQAHLIYFSELEAWSARLHNKNTSEERKHRMARPDAIVSAFTFRRDQFARLAKGSGAQFVAGLQPYLDSKPQLSALEIRYKQTPEYQSKSHRNMRALYDAVGRSAAPAGATAINFHALFSDQPSQATLFTDIAHTTPQANALMADIYARHLWNECGNAWGTLA